MKFVFCLGFCLGLFAFASPGYLSCVLSGFSRNLGTIMRSGLPSGVPSFH